MDTTPSPVASSQASPQVLAFDVFGTVVDWHGSIVREVQTLEHKSRRQDVLVDDELIFAFYDAIIPRVTPGAEGAMHDDAGVIHNGAAFESWRIEAEKKNPKLLFAHMCDSNC